MSNHILFKVTVEMVGAVSSRDLRRLLRLGRVVMETSKNVLWCCCHVFCQHRTVCSITGVLMRLMMLAVHTSDTDGSMNRPIQHSRNT
ncbi:unnamed protein product [Protopolystoma xenopodis]|uniref:Uncharacterized protein n=1 Tax=Protopolystoma xenopodis TaxID=117903 RepID=A0A3S5B3A7_9PLAT|nr:unnamed protein product [Protopolystoma xenopodis]